MKVEQKTRVISFVGVGSANAKPVYGGRISDEVCDESVEQKETNKGDHVKLASERVYTDSRLAFFEK